MAAALVDSDAALGVLPLGTLNHFAKDLGIPLELDAAALACLPGQRANVVSALADHDADLPALLGRGAFDHLLRLHRGMRASPAIQYAGHVLLQRSSFLSDRPYVTGDMLPSTLMDVPVT